MEVEIESVVITKRKPSKEEKLEKEREKRKKWVHRGRKE